MGDPIAETGEGGWKRENLQEGERNVKLLEHQETQLEGVSRCGAWKFLVNS